MRFPKSSLIALAASLAAQQTATAAVCEDNVLPTNPDDFDEPMWEAVLEAAFPTWEAPEGGCPRLDTINGELADGYDEFPVPEEGKFNPCYYTKAFAGLDPTMGGYPTPIDTHYPYEFAAPFLKQPGDGSVHHCSSDAAANIGACPKLGNTCGPDCAVISDEYGIGHIPPFVPLAAIKNAYTECSDDNDICKDWFHYETNGCNIKKSVMDELVYKYFGDGNTIKFQPPILLDGAPSTTYFRLEYGGLDCADDNCRGPHYCSKDVADAGGIWGDFCPYVHTGEKSGLYRHPHLALAALELWIANKCMPDKCASEWLQSPNGQGYGTDPMTSTSITWCEMDDNMDPIAQPALPYKWPNSGEASIFPGLELYGDKPVKKAPGVYVNEVVDIDAEECPSSRKGKKDSSYNPKSKKINKSKKH